MYTPFNSYASNSSENRWFGVRPTISRNSEARLPIPEFEWVLWSSSRWLLKPLGLQQKVCQTHLHYVEFSLFNSPAMWMVQLRVPYISHFRKNPEMIHGIFNPANFASHEESTMTPIHFSLKPSTVHVKTTGDWFRLDPMLDGFKMKRISLQMNPDDKNISRNITNITNHKRCNVAYAILQKITSNWKMFPPFKLDWKIKNNPNKTMVNYYVLCPRN